MMTTSIMTMTIIITTNISRYNMAISYSRMTYVVLPFVQKWSQLS